MTNTLTRRRVLIAVLVLLFIGVGAVAWTLAGLPPVKYYLRYGLDPYCEPTGEKVTYEGVEFVEIGPGIFRMGSAARGEDADWIGRLCRPLGLHWGKRATPSDEMPVRWVEFRRGYWIATTEITNAQYEAFDSSHRRAWCGKGDDHPVSEVTWTGAKAYCTWLAAKAGRLVRLPSEAEWECACRAGSDAEYACGDDWQELSKTEWLLEPWGTGARPVGTKPPNRWGLHDMNGNVSEWCADRWHLSYEGAPSDGSARVHSTVRGAGVIGRGPCWGQHPYGCRSAGRMNLGPDGAIDTVGFRPAFSNPEDE